MNKIRLWRNLLLIVVFAGFLALTDNPWKLPKLEKNIPVITPVWNWMQESMVSLGLDLQGGTQLDYEIDLKDARARNIDDNTTNDVNIPALLAGVKDVIEKRVNSLGVAEPNIYLSSAGDEEHIVVELPGVKDINEAKEKVGKVVQLEFKTEKGEPTQEEIDAITIKAEEFQKKLSAEKSVEDLEDYMKDLVVPNQIEYKKDEKAFLDELPGEVQKIVKDLKPQVFYPKTVRSKEASYIFNNGQVQQPEGINIVRLIETSTELRKRPANAEDFGKVMEEFDQKKSDDYVRKEAISPENLALEISSLGNGEISSVVETDNGYFIAKMENKIAADESEKPVPQIRAAHILLKTETPTLLTSEKSFKEIAADAKQEDKDKLAKENAAIATENEKIKKDNQDLIAKNDAITKKNAEIEAKAKSILEELKESPERFADLAKKNSEDTSAEKGGDLGYSDPAKFVEPFSKAALALENGAITNELVKTQFGFHIIKLLDKKEANEEIYQYSTIRICFEGNTDCSNAMSKDDAKKKADEVLKRVREETNYTLERVWFNAVPDPWAKTDLDARFFKRADVAYDQISYRPYVGIQFDDEGAKLFEKITGENIKKKIGIFVGGEFISAPVVNEKISGGQAQITLGQTNVQLALKEANDLAGSLNAGSIPAPLKRPNELNIGASLGIEALHKSLYAGALGLLLVVIFMTLYYRFMGFLASISLLLYGLFLLFIIQSELPPVIALTVSFVMWIAFVLRLFKSKIDGIGQAIFLIFSVLGVLFVFSVLVNPIVLTLAGVAGIILSIGMAVDANILIFERMKEEFAAGKSFLTAINDGFDRAWNSILDSNVSSLITCAILFSFGTSIIKGFAINLAVGIVISMFTAITVTKTLLLLFEGSAVERMHWLWKRKTKAD
jgi:preprotein translocase subunit SecD